MCVSLGWQKKNVFFFTNQTRFPCPSKFSNFGPRHYRSPTIPDLSHHTESSRYVQYNTHHILILASVIVFSSFHRRFVSVSCKLRANSGIRFVPLTSIQLPFFSILYWNFNHGLLHFDNWISFKNLFKFLSAYENIVRVVFFKKKKCIHLTYTNQILRVVRVLQSFNNTQLRRDVLLFVFAHF